MRRPLKKRAGLLGDQIEPIGPIRVAVLGSGGREHALAAKIALSPLAREVVILPGNAGMARAGLKTVEADLSNHAAVIDKLQRLEIDLVVVGPDNLLAAGMVDDLGRAGIAAFGPTAAAARIESSKSFAKQLMEAAHVPTAKYEILTMDEAPKLRDLAARLGGYPLVLKYDGLALGKGVRICADEAAAQHFIKEVFEERKFSCAKDSGTDVIIAEQCLRGHEVSLFALTDGQAYVLLEPACDHKRLLEGDLGPNTGGMGAFSPVPWLSRERARAISGMVFPPLLEKMREAGVPFRGLLYAGLMVLGDDFWVLEFNARFGDPETQAILPRLESDLLPLLYGVATDTFERNLDACPPRWSSKACVNVVAVSRGYPEKPETGFSINGIETAGGPGIQVYYAGVNAGQSGLVSAGGRVLGVSVLDESVELAGRRALTAIEGIKFEGIGFRRDIGSVKTGV